MTVTTGDILRIVASQLWNDGNVVQNVFNSLISGAGSPWDDVDVVSDAEDWLDNMYANLTTLVSEDLAGNEVIVYKYDSGDDDWDEVGSAVWSWSPSATSDELPRGVAGLVRLWTEDPDVQGKKYIAGLPESTTDDGLFISAALTGLLAFGADWWNPFVGSATGADFTPGIWSVAQTAFKEAVEHVASTTIPAYQRRRKRNVGV